MARRRAIAAAAIGVVLLALLAPGVGKAQEASISNDLVSCWDMEELTGTRYDSYGSNHLTDVNTVNRDRGVKGYSAYSIGTNAEDLSKTNNSSLHIGDTSFSWSLWVYQYQTGVLNNIIAKYTSLPNGEYIARIETTNKINLIIMNGTTSANVLSTEVLDAHKWYFVSAWYDSEADTLNLQVNNGEVYSIAFAGGTKTTDGSPILLGSFYGTGSNALDSVMFWKGRVLSSSEREWLYNSSFGRSCSDVIVQPTPTPSYRQDVILSSGNHLAVDRIVSYGDISVFAIIGGLFVLGFVFGIVRLIKLWF